MSNKRTNTKGGNKTGGVAIKMRSWNKLGSAQVEQIAKNEGDEDEDTVNETKGMENESAVDKDKDAMIGDESAGTGDEDIMD